MADTSSQSSSQPLTAITNQQDKTTNGTMESINPKSPLEFTWTFWYIKPDKRQSWEQSLVNLIDVGFVEDFWATFNHLASPLRLAQNKSNSDYYFFKRGSTCSFFTSIPIIHSCLSFFFSSSSTHVG